MCKNLQGFNKQQQQQQLRHKDGKPVVDGEEEVEERL